MNNTIDAAAEFDRKLQELQQEARPSHLGANLKEIVLYEKLLQLENRLNKIADRLPPPGGS